MNKITPNCKIWLDSGESGNVFGDGKFRLLQAIDRYGSLIQACKKLKISYRKAWSDLNKAELCLQMKLVNRSRGGANGGQTLLTNEAVKVLKEYTRLSKSVRKTLTDSFKRFERVVGRND